MPPRRVFKSSKAKAVTNVPNDTQKSSLGPAAPVPSQPGVKVRRTRSRVPVSFYITPVVATYLTATRLKPSKRPIKNRRKALLPLLPID